MIYLDSSVVLAYLLVETQRPADDLFGGPVVTSRLVEYEVWNRLHAYGKAVTHGEATRALLARVAMLGLTPDVLARAVDPFPLPVRTLDGLHLASIEHLRSDRRPVALATYDRRMQTAAAAMGISLVAL